MMYNCNNSNSCQTQVETKNFLSLKLARFKLKSKLEVRESYRLFMLWIMFVIAPFANGTKTFRMIDMIVSFKWIAKCNKMKAIEPNDCESYWVDLPSLVIATWKELSCFFCAKMIGFFFVSFLDWYNISFDYSWK